MDFRWEKRWLSLPAPAFDDCEDHLRIELVFGFPSWSAPILFFDATLSYRIYLRWLARRQRDLRLKIWLSDVLMWRRSVVTVALQEALWQRPSPHQVIDRPAVPDYACLLA